MLEHNLAEDLSSGAAYYVPRRKIPHVVGGIVFAKTIFVHAEGYIQGFRAKSFFMPQYPRIAACGGCVWGVQLEMRYADEPDAAAVCDRSPAAP